MPTSSASFSILIRHAGRNLPFYEERLRQSGVDPEAELTDEAWQRLPVLTRRDIQTHRTRLHATDYPPAHGGFAEATSGGSTGIPFAYAKPRWKVCYGMLPIFGNYCGTT